MYTKEELMKMNNRMISLGNPDKYDGIGYNKIDYNFCNSLYDKETISDKQAIVLAKILKKYIKQLQMPNASKFDEFINNYDKKEITLCGSKNGMIFIKFPYDQNIISIIKTIPYKDRTYEPANKSWGIAINKIPLLLGNLEKFTSKIDLENLKKVAELQKNGKINEIVEIPEKVDKIPEIKLNFPSKIKVKPFKYQIEAATRLILNKKMLLCLMMGYGKSLTSLIAAYNNKGKKLIICPASLALNWQREMIRFGIDESDTMIISKNSPSVNDIDNHTWFIINYSMLHLITTKNNKSYIPYVWIKFFSTLIIDEAHYCKSITSSGAPSAIRGKICDSLCKYFENVYLLTGTPITNKTKDVYNLLKFVNCPLTKNWFGFAYKYCGAIKNDFGWNFDGSTNRKELNEILKNYMIRDIGDDIIDIPDKVRSFIPCDVNLKDYYMSIKEYMDKRKNIDMGEKLVLLNGAKMILAKLKVESTIDFINNMLSNNKQVVVFTCYNEVIDKICEIIPECTKINGSMNVKDRQKSIDDFQSGKCKVIVCNIIAGGVGINLTSSSTVIFNDYDWTATNIIQAEDRIHRIGQKEICNIFYMYCKGAEIDEKLINLLENKFNNSSAIVDGKSTSLFYDIMEILDNE